MFEQEFSNLNPEQQKAVRHTNGPALVIAGAGSGKTRVATMRIAHLIQSGIPAEQIVAVTFTNKAAKEMRERVQKLVGSQVLVSTFHSLGARILRESIDLLDYPLNFAIYAEDESEKIVKNILKDLSLKDEKASKIRSLLSSIKAEPETLNSHDSLTKNIFNQYQRTLKQYGAVDFDDLIYLPLQLFQRFPESVQKYNSRWKYLLVDEYQDTSESQYKFALNLSGKEQNIFAVGDPDQSIYSWRGAKISNILSFQESFPTSIIIRLEQNYRSTNTILSASNSVIQNNRGRYEKKLWSTHSKGELISLFKADNERREAEYVSKTISSLSSQGVTYDNIALLYRTNAQSRALEEQMLNSNIPYRIWGGTPFYSRKEIRDILSLLQVASLPQDALSWERAVRCLASGIGPATMGKLHALAMETNQPILSATRDAISATNILSKKQRDSLGAFCQSISTLQEHINGGSAYALISSAIHDTGYLNILEKDPESASERRENLEQLLARAQEWDDTHEEISPLLLIEELVLEGRRDQKNGDGPQVTLATIHNAKGLEFDCIFLVGLEEDIFPHINAKKEAEQIEEERRLFYVGMTRAKQRLYISCAKTRFIFGGQRYMIPSRFLKEIPSTFTSNATLFPFSRSPARIEAPRAAQPLSLGQKVLHPSFGIGRIQTIVSTKAGDAYEVLFSNTSEKKKILVAHSPMKALGTP